MLEKGIAGTSYEEQKPNCIGSSGNEATSHDWLVTKKVLRESCPLAGWLYVELDREKKSRRNSTPHMTVVLTRWVNLSSIQ